MKYNSVGENNYRLPKVKIPDTVKWKSTFIDHNRRSYQDVSLDDLDLSYLDKSNKVKKLKKDN